MKKSKIRGKILNVLKQSPKLLSSQDIHTILNDYDLASIYRNLSKLVENHEVRELRIKKGESLYEINDDDHHHAVCNVCGKIEHIKINTKKLLQHTKIPDFEIEDIEITINGHCKK